MNLITFTLILFMYYPGSTKVDQEMRPVLVENFDACFHEGRIQAAQHWGNVPGLTFRIVCLDPDGTMKAEGAKGGGGHPALSFQRED